MRQNQPLGGSTSLAFACNIVPKLTKALGQWQLPLADDFRVRTHVPVVWGSIPSQIDPITSIISNYELVN